MIILEPDYFDQAATVMCSLCSIRSGKTFILPDGWHIYRVNQEFCRAEYYICWKCWKKHEKLFDSFKK